MIRINDLKIKIEEEHQLLQEIAKKLKVRVDDIKQYQVVKRSTDARDNTQIFFVFTVDVQVQQEQKLLKQNKRLLQTIHQQYVYPSYGQAQMKYRPIVIGFGPSGMFAALLLAEMGLKPIVFERGSDVKKRMKDVDLFWTKRVLNPNSNMQFGEGGAGTFSDGKLTTRVKDVRGRKVLEEFVQAGANEEILYVHNPHIGTDILVKVVEGIRNKIIALGGEIHFNHTLKKIEIENGRVKSIQVNDQQFECDDVILAIGHSARDTFEMLHQQGVMMQQKPFAVGLRIEHPQVMVNQAQYGPKYFDYPKLGAAEYKLTHRASNDKSVYTFCMCPGGQVVACSSEEHTVVVNGMSEYARDRVNANSAVVCTVDSIDFGSDHPLAGMLYQRCLEEEAFQLGGANYDAPIQLVGDFIKNQPSSQLRNVIPSYPIGYKLTNLNSLFSPTIQEALQEAIKAMDQKLKGFALEDAVLTGVETRTSSPVRIVRDNEQLESLNVKGLFPCGEGAGYAGGIMSAAMDGLKIAEKIIQKYNKN